MPGTATLDATKLVDSLVPVIDALRGALNPAFAVRAFRVYSVLESWTGPKVGAGTRSQTVTEILPQPLVQGWDRVGGLRYDLETCGLATIGEVVVSEVSLSYTYSEIAGGNLPVNQRWMIRISEAHGQAQPDRDFYLSRPPYPDREKDIGWVMFLRKAGP